MNQREKILAGAVVAVLLVLAGQWGYGKYRGAVKQRETRIFTLNDQIGTRQAKQLEGALAERRMGEYSLRSLPSDLETAQGTYTQFLSNLISKNDLQNSAAKPTTTTGLPGLYTQFNYNVTGSGTLEQMLHLLYDFHRQDFLHRINNLTLRKTREGVVLSMDVQALAMARALPDVSAPEEPSPRLADSFDHYLLPIMNRNPMSPPNQSPAYAADQRIEATVGEDFTYVTRFNDPDEQQQLSYTLVGEVPEGLQFDESSGRLSLRPEATGSLELTVRARDDGWPAKSTEQQIVINVVDPPPEPETAERPIFDEARQTFLTGLTQSRGRWMAMLHIRTQGKSERLYEGDDFEIGQMKGKVVEVTARYAVLETEGERFVLRLGTSLQEAWEASAP